MVKIRLRRTGTKGRPYYRIVVAHSTCGRNGKFVENLGTYDPVVKPVKIVLNEEKAMAWLEKGAQPSETAAYILNKVGVLGKYHEQRPALKHQYRFLDKRTAAISVGSVMETQPSPVAPVVAEPKAEPVAEVAPAVIPQPAEASEEHGRDARATVAEPVEAAEEHGRDARATVAEPVVEAVAAAPEVAAEDVPAAEEKAE